MLQREGRPHDRTDEPAAAASTSAESATRCRLPRTGAESVTRCRLPRTAADAIRNSAAPTDRPAQRAGHGGFSDRNRRTAVVFDHRGRRGSRYCGGGDGFHGSRASGIQAKANNGGVALAGVVLGFLSIVAGLVFIPIYLYLGQRNGNRRLLWLHDESRALYQAAQQQCETSWSQHVETKFSVTLTTPP